jgi:hypothetical protein
MRRSCRCVSTGVLFTVSRLTVPAEQSSRGRTRRAASTSTPPTSRASALAAAGSSSAQTPASSIRHGSSLQAMSRPFSAKTAVSGDGRRAGSRVSTAQWGRASAVDHPSCSAQSSQSRTLRASYESEVQKACSPRGWPRKGRTGCDEITSNSRCNIRRAKERGQRGKRGERRSLRATAQVAGATPASRVGVAHIRATEKACERGERAGRVGAGTHGMNSSPSARKTSFSVAATTGRSMSSVRIPPASILRPLRSQAWSASQTRRALEGRTPASHGPGDPARTACCRSTGPPHSPAPRCL